VKNEKSFVFRAVLSAGVLLLSLSLMVCRGRQAQTGPAVAGGPPAGLAVSEIPQFVCVSTDDNGFSGLPGSGSDGGLRYLTSLFAARRNPAGSGNPGSFDGVSPHYTFFVVSGYLAPEADTPPDTFYSGADLPVFVKQAWREAVDQGHEIGIHTHSHPHGRALTAAEWEEEMRRAIDLLTRPWDPEESPGYLRPGSGLGLSPSALAGFRSPYLEWSENGLAAAHKAGFVYDSSLEDGPALGPHRGEFAWPYLLDRHPGFWEMPIVDFVVPPDEACPRYGLPAGFRAALKERQSYFDPENGEITGMDWNLWIEFSMTPVEFLATLKYSLDLRLAGSRSPMPLGLHSELYTVKSGDAPATAAAIYSRRAALEEFLDYVLSKPEARLVSHRELLDWIRRPVPLR